MLFEPGGERKQLTPKRKKACNSELSGNVDHVHPHPPILQHEEAQPTKLAQHLGKTPLPEADQHHKQHNKSAPQLQSNPHPQPEPESVHQTQIAKQLEPWSTFFENSLISSSSSADDSTEDSNYKMDPIEMREAYIDEDIQHTKNKKGKKAYGKQAKQHMGVNNDNIEESGVDPQGDQENNDGPQGGEDNDDVNEEYHYDSKDSVHWDQILDEELAYDDDELIAFRGELLERRRSQLASKWPNNNDTRGHNVSDTIPTESLCNEQENEDKRSNEPQARQSGQVAKLLDNL